MSWDDQRSKKVGIVHLVGAGPGDPMLLTRQALRLLRQADVVAYDDLVHPALLNLARPEAEILAVGYRGLRDTAMTQAVLAPEVIAKARAGLTVVRLKTGDPLVLGRGGEEALALTQLGIPFTIVPGITAALGAAAAASIPLTHRSLAAGFRLVTGHRLADVGGWSAELGSPDETLVVYMVRKHLQDLVDDLLVRGWRSQTPAAFVLNATTPSQKVLTAPISELPRLLASTPETGPGLVIIGPTVDLHHQLVQAHKRGPLAGRRILVGRARPGVSQVADALRGLGADVIEAPRLVPEDLADSAALDRAIAELDRADIWAFGCDISVHRFVRRLSGLKRDVRDLPRRRLMATGKAAQRALQHYGWQVEISLPGACGEAMAPVGKEVHGKTVFLFSHHRGRPQLVKELSGLGAQVTEVATYGLKAQYPRIVAPEPQLIVVPSSSAARLLFQGDLGFDWRRVPVVAIGPESARAAEACGAQHVYRTEHDQIEDLVARTVEILACDQGAFPSVFAAPQGAPAAAAKTGHNSSTLSVEIP